MLKQYSLLTLLLLNAGCASQAPSNPSGTPLQAAEPPQQGACFSLVYQSSRGPARLPNELAGPTRCTFHVKALKQPCLVALAAYQGSSSLAAPHLKPAVFSLGADQETEMAMTVGQDTPITQIWVSVMAKDSSEANEVQQLVQRCSSPASQGNPALALHQKLALWWGRQDFQMSRSGSVPAELGGVVSTSAQAIHPTAQSTLDEKQNVPAGRSKEVVPLKKANLEAWSYDWKSQADWVGCAPGLPEVFLYTLNVK